MMVQLKKISLSIPIVVLMLIIAVNPAVSDNELINDLKDSYKEFVKDEVIPTKLAWKAMLDDALTEDELDLLNDLRQKNTVLNASIKQLTKDFAAAKKEGDQKKINEIKKKMEEKKNEKKEIVKQLKPILENHKDVIAEITKQANTKKKEWKTKVDEIFNEWMKENEDKIDSKMKNKIKKKVNEMKNFEINFKNAKQLIKFVLWDGETTMF